MKKRFWQFASSFIVAVILFPTLLFSQENTVEMADVMRENGKIYVVVAVISVILAAFLIALITIDKRVRKIEKRNSKD